MKLKAGITGPLGSGKSTVTKLLVSMGAWAVDVDRAGHYVLERNKGVQKQLAETFGSDILKGGHIDRKLLGERVFAAGRHDQLNKIVHPPMIERVLSLLSKADRHALRPLYLIVDAALLFELGLHHYTDVTVTVDAPGEQLVDRIRKRDNLSRSQILQRMQSQWPAEKKIELSDYLIENIGSIEDLRHKTQTLHHWLVNRIAT
ncbi:dephospho-CoA kinase [candidate division KSB1 bacterium]|nr:dephospho-CoA kinase [candidate division KSB1 bacterium]